MKKDKINEMMATIPTEKGINADMQALRVSIISELDAISLYEQLAEIVQDENVKKVLLDVAKEEKTHVSEFETLLLKLDPEQKKEMKAGEKEVEDVSEGINPMEQARERLFGKTQSQSLNEMKMMFKKLVL